MARSSAGPKARSSTAEVELTTDQKSFIRINSKIMDDGTLAKNTGVAVAAVESYRKALAAESGRGRADEQMHRPAAGVVAMTDAASAIGDDHAHMDVVTRSEINRLLAAGDKAGAARLEAARDGQVRDKETLARARNHDRWHIIDRDRR